MDQKLEELEKRQERESNRAFLSMLYVVGYLAIPAGIGAWIGTWLDARYNSGHRFAMLALFLAFILSWTMIIMEYKRMTARLERLRDEERAIRRERKEHIANKQNRDNDFPL